MGPFVFRPRFDGLRARVATESGRVAMFAVAYAGSAAVQKGLGFVLFMWLAHRLSVADYARFGLLYALQAGVATLALAGIVEAAVGGLKAAQSTEARRHLLGSVNLVFVGTVLVATIAVPLTFAWVDAFTPASLTAAAVAGGLTAFFTLQAQLSRIVERHVPALIVGFAPALAGLAGGLAGVLIAPTAFGFFCGSAVGLLLATPLARLAGAGIEKPASPESRAGYILSNLAPFVLVAAIDWFMGYGSTYLVKLFFATEVVARFVFAYTLSSILHLVATSLNQAWSPRVYNMIHSGDLAQVESGNRQFYLLQGALLGVVGGAILIALPLIFSFSGTSMLAYRNMQTEMLLLFAAYALLIPWYHAQNFFYAHAKGGLLMQISAASTVIGVLLWIAAAVTLGPIGAYVGFALMFAAKALTAAIVARRTWGIAMLWQGPVLGLCLLAAGFWISSLMG